MARELVIRHCDTAEAWHVAARSTLDRLDHAVRTTIASAPVQTIWRHFVDALREHFAEEEAILFPALRALARGELPEGDDYLRQLDAMEEELDGVRHLTATLRLYSRELGRLEDDFLEFVEALEDHARREQEELLPAARLLIAELHGIHLLRDSPPDSPDSRTDPPRAAIDEIERSR
ncbi:MAG: hypothetical protein D6798_03510 [Deltaproteobacteria bacterium]|nr:MAG: hypothetical protein D6798_03510 [Deltaproteobacteria bacterium]